MSPPHRVKSSWIRPGRHQKPGLSNETLNGSFTQITPLAAVCEPSWPQYNQAECQHISSRWNISGFCRGPSTKTT